jgi:hypothetical protein
LNLFHIFRQENLRVSNKNIKFAKQRLKAMLEVINRSRSGDCFWAAFLKMGALLENSPNHAGSHN